MCQDVGLTKGSKDVQINQILACLHLNLHSVSGLLIDFLVNLRVMLDFMSGLWLTD
jgi:hypothetical protein